RRRAGRLLPRGWKRRRQSRRRPAGRPGRLRRPWAVRRAGGERVRRHSGRRRRAAPAPRGSAMTVGGLHHTSYTVSNLDRSLGFYRDALGCEVLAMQEKQGGYLAAIVGYPNAHVRMAHLRVPGSDHVIELFQYLAPQGDHADVEPRNVGASHLCFLVEDLPAFYERLRQ